MKCMFAAAHHVAIWLSLLTACSGAPVVGPRSGQAPSAPPSDRGLPDAGRPSADLARPPDAPRVVGCWERTYGKPLGPASHAPTLPGPIPGCPGCEKLRAGPLGQGLHVEVLKKVRGIEASLPSPPVDEPVLWINSGNRSGPAHKSMHNQGLAVDLVICGKDSLATARHLRSAGFSCVIEYFDVAGRPCRMAHGDMRNTRWARSAYAPGGRKARTCPRRGVSKSADCNNSRKEQWSY